MPVLAAHSARSVKRAVTLQNFISERVAKCPPTTPKYDVICADFPPGRCVVRFRVWQSKRVTGLPRTVVPKTVNGRRNAESSDVSKKWPNKSSSAPPVEL